MKGAILGVLPYITFLLFFIYLFRAKNASRAYVLFCLYFFPLIYSPDHTYNVFQAITYFYFFYSFRSNKPIFSKYSHPLVWYVIICLFVGALLSEFMAHAMVGLIGFLPIIIFIHVLLFEVLEDDSFMFKVIDILKLNLLIAIIFVFLQVGLGLNFALFVTDNPNITFEAIRYPGIFQDPQKFAQFLSALSFITLIDSPTSPKFTKYKYALLVFAVLSLFLTGGRAALLGLAAGVVFIAFFSNNKVRFATIAGAGVVVALAFVFSSYFAIFNRGESLKDSYDTRNEIWQVAIKIFTQHPLFGIGISNYSSYVEVHAKDQYWLVGGEKVYFDHPESGYLKYLAEFGLLGTIGVLMFIFSAIYRGLKTFLKKVKDFYIVFLIASLITWMLGFYSVYSFSDTRIMILISTIACVLIAYSKRYDKGFILID
ncbi:O-antigen ligase family protein [Mucilaginibacter sp. HMF5004]|uniref:O-antigen ligase family protein n=1 Tax=Mucilaginibacter rivuli TaxID=2857527 RepID=UPI001C601285|nr:O-antigen ligase family protein [Mucilaginibacter rivuli]MBW4890067.1 O-antigen ligase family protein [Mucilaginibacter rivuli]